METNATYRSESHPSTAGSSTGRPSSQSDRSRSGIAEKALTESGGAALR
ncbi:hypothetical protein AB0K16_39670 [Nonomuraea jabiensis]